MPNGKLENELNLALDIPEADRAKTLNLNVGYSPNTNTWELIVKYSGSLDRIREELDISAVELVRGYAILTIPEYLIDRLTDYGEVEFVEKPKRLFYEVNEGRTASCINPLQTGIYNLFGEGVLVAVIDSELIIPTRISGMKTEPRGYWHYGIRPYREHRRKGLTLELFIPESKLMKL